MACFFGAARLFHSSGIRRPSEYFNTLRSHRSVGRVVEVTPNVAGSVTSISIEPNVLVKAGTILFQSDLLYSGFIDATPNEERR